MHIERLETRIQWSTTPTAVAAAAADVPFGQNGTVTIDAFDLDAAQAVVVQGDGKVVVAGWSGTSTEINGDGQTPASSITMARLNPDGTLDPTFGSAGLANFPVPANTSSLLENMPLILLSDGSFLLGGTGLRKISSFGKLVTSFGTNGIAGGDANLGVADMKLTSGGKVVTMDYQFGFKRFNADGSVDTSFGTNGAASAQAGLSDPSSSSRQMAIQPDGKIVAAGEVQIAQEGRPRYALARLNADGSPDTSFGTNGYVYAGTAKQGLQAGAVEISPDGEILVAGTSWSGSSLGKFFADGTLDWRFGQSGLVVDDAHQSDEVYDIAVDAEGRIYLASDYGGDVLRYNADGTFDTDYGSDVSSGGFHEASRLMAMGPDGKLFVPIELDLADGSDNADSYKSQADFYVERLDNTGATGPAVPPPSMAATVARPATQLQTDGTLLVTGTSGDDQLTIDLSGSNVRVNRNGVITSFAQSSVKSIDLDGGAGNDTITTTTIDIPQRLDGGDGNDTILSGAGNDTILGGDGDNSINAGAGNDDIDADTGNDTINAGAGDDTIDGSGGNNSLIGGGGSDSITAGNGNNFIQLDAGHVACGDSTGNNTIVGGDGGCDIQGGYEGTDSITTGAGNDTIDSGYGPDTISTGDGNDTIVTAGSPATDSNAATGAIIDAGDGNDNIFCDYAASIDGGNGDDAIGAYAGAGTVTGGDGNDRLHINSDSHNPAVIHGGNGDDRIYAGDGNDSITGDAGRDTIHAGDGNDQVSGGGGNDKLFGQGGDDKLYGGRGNDRLEGLAGNDSLDGAAGADIINGGDGTDAAKHDDPLDVLTDVENELV